MGTPENNQVQPTGSNADTPQIQEEQAMEIEVLKDSDNETEGEKE